jgi:hypothetical protein
MEEHEDPGLPPRHTTTKTTKKRWECRALLIEFAPHQYPRVSNYPTISKNTMDPRSRNHGSQTTYRKSKNKGDSNAKSAITPHRRSQVMVEQIGKRNNRKLGGTHEAIYE